jgi:hypothetical protein
LITDEQFDAVFADPALPRPKKELGGKVKLSDGTVIGWQMTKEPELSWWIIDNVGCRTLKDTSTEVWSLLPRYVTGLHDRYWGEVAKRLDQIQ